MRVDRVPVNREVATGSNGGAPSRHASIAMRKEWLNVAIDRRNEDNAFIA